MNIKRFQKVVLIVCLIATVILLVSIHFNYVNKVHAFPEEVDPCPQYFEHDTVKKYCKPGKVFKASLRSNIDNCTPKPFNVIDKVNKQTRCSSLNYIHTNCFNSKDDIVWNGITNGLDVTKCSL